MMQILVKIIFVEIPPCEKDNGGCAHWCAHIEGGGYKCLCKPGFLLDVDLHDCIRKQSGYNVTTLVSLGCGVYKLKNDGIKDIDMCIALLNYVIQNRILNTVYRGG